MSDEADQDNDKGEERAPADLPRPDAAPASTSPDNDTAQGGLLPPMPPIPEVAVPPMPPIPDVTVPPMPPIPDVTVPPAARIPHPEENERMPALPAISPPPKDAPGTGT